MYSLGLLLLFCMALVSSNQEDIISLEDRIKAHLNSNPTTKQILAGIYDQPMTPQFKSLLHLSLNYLLISNEVFASTEPQDSLGLPQAADNIQQENEKLPNLLGTQEERKECKDEYASLSSEIAAAVNQ